MTVLCGCCAGSAAGAAKEAAAASKEGPHPKAAGGNAMRCSAQFKQPAAASSSELVCTVFHQRANAGAGLFLSAVKQTNMSTGPFQHP